MSCITFVGSGAKTVLLTSMACMIAACTDIPSLPPTVPPASALTIQPAARTQVQGHINQDFNITFQVPADWRPCDPKDECLFHGADGFVRLTSAYNVGEKAETVCASFLECNARADKDPNAQSGTRPEWEQLQVDDQSACLILPSGDQRPATGGALLVVQYPRACEHNRILMLWADTAHIREIAASLRFSPPPQSLASLLNTPSFVELDTFSGVPNPIWALDAALNKEFLMRFVALSPGPVVNYPDQLGYRGLLVHFNLPPYGMPETVQVFQGAVCYDLGGTRTCRVDADREVERWLLETADRSQVDAQLLARVAHEMPPDK